MEREITKSCTRCKKLLPLKDFYVDRQKSDGLSPQCKTCRKGAVGDYRTKNLRKCQAASRRRHQMNKEIINLQRRVHKDISGRGQFNKLNPEHFDFGASNRKSPGESSFARLVRQYRASATRRGIEFSLSTETVRTLTSANCTYCGVEPRQVMRSKDSNGSYIYNGIDRIEASVGYIDGNCTAACKICNRAKTDMTASEWREWLVRVARFQIDKDEMPKSLAKAA